MTQLVAGLIGVILGAVVSEALRARSERVRQTRILTGARRLLLDDLLTAGVLVAPPVDDVDRLRGQIRTRTLSDATWEEHKTLFAEHLPVHDWMTLSGVMFDLHVLLLGVDSEDKDLIHFAEKLAKSVEEGKELLVDMEAESMVDRRGLSRFF